MIRIAFVFVFLFQFVMLDAKGWTDQGAKSYWTAVRKKMPEFSKVFKKYKNYRLELLVTRVHRNDKNQVSLLQRFHFGDSLSYHYPASTVKLPAAVFLMEKLRSQLKGASIEMFLKMDSAAFCGGQRYENNFPLYQRVMKPETLKDFSRRMLIPLNYLERINPGLHADSLLRINTTVRISERNYFPTLRDLLSAMLVYSDNDAFNRIFEVVGPEFFQSRFNELQMQRSQISQRLLYCPVDVMTKGPDYTLIDRDSVTQLVQSRAKSVQVEMVPDKSTIVGKKHMDANNQVQRGGKDFGKKNRLPLAELHRLLEKLVLHDYIPEKDRLQLGMFEQRTLLRWLGNHPREVHRMRTNQYDGLQDAYSNFILYGGSAERIPESLRIMNISGWAYGFMTDCAYICEVNTGTEVFVSARIYVNEDGIIGNDNYEYETIGKPFMKRLGEVVLELEKQNKKEFLPNLVMYGGIFK